MRAIVIGGTGASGSALIQNLIADPHFEQVVLLSRRLSQVNNKKLCDNLIDFDNSASFQDKLTGEVLFLALGTTIKAAGSQQSQYQVDFTYQYKIAKAAREQGVNKCVLISSQFASSRSKSFYLRMKGELEEALIALNFPQLSILRPSFLIRPHTDRLGEKLGVLGLKTLNKLGLCQNMSPMPVAVLAQAMKLCAFEQQAKLQILESHQIFKLVQKQA